MKPNNKSLMMYPQKFLNYHQTTHTHSNLACWYNKLSSTPPTPATVCKSAAEEDKSTAQTALNWGNQSCCAQQFDEAIEYFRIALQIYTQIDEFIGIGKSLNGLSAAHLGLQQYERALAYSQASVSILESTEFVEDYALATYQLGVSHLNLHNLPQAEEFLHQALNLYIHLQDAVNEDRVALHLGQLYSQNQEHLFALAAYESVLDSLLERPLEATTQALLTHVLDLIMEVCETTHQADIAVLPYKRVLEQSIIMENPEALAPIFHQLGQFYESQKRYGLSIACYAQAPQTISTPLEL